MFAPPLQALDNFLLQYNLGQVLLVVFVLVLIVAFFLQRSARVLSVQAIGFGVLFMIVPTIDAPTTYVFLGIALVLIAPLIYVSADR